MFKLLWMLPVFYIELSTYSLIYAWAEIRSTAKLDFFGRYEVYSSGFGC